MPRSSKAVAKDNKKIGRLVWIGSVLATVALVSAVAASWFLYGLTINLLTDNLRERLLSISITQAANINPESIKALQKEEDWTKPEWREVVGQLKRAKDQNEDIVFMYIFRRTAEDPTQMEFVADAESINPYANSDNDPTNDVDSNRDGVVDPEGADYLQWPGQPYPEAVDIPEAYEAYNGPLTAAELYEDSFGRVLTGYSPIIDENGEVVAILATDIKADDFFTVTRQTLYPFLAFIAFLVLVIAFLSISLIRIWQKRATTLAELSLQLEKANSRLKQLDRMKSEFVSIASHQLRSPLTSIRGYASMLLEGSYGKLPKKASEVLAKVAESTQMMALSVEDYLNVSRIESGNMKYELSEFNLVDLVKNIVDEFRPVAIKHGLVLSCQTKGLKAVLIKADIGKTKQIIQNLIDNALKYTKKGSIKVKLEVEGKKVFVHVVDTGIGMSEEIQEDIFEKFERAQNANEVNVTGTGLGLFIARRMAHDMKGEVTAQSAGEGKGSTFTVEFPLAKRAS